MSNETAASLSDLLLHPGSKSKTSFPKGMVELRIWIYRAEVVGGGGGELRFGNQDRRILLQSHIDTNLLINIHYRSFLSTSQRLYRSILTPLCTLCVRTMLLRTAKHWMAVGYIWINISNSAANQRSSMCLQTRNGRL